MSLVNDYFISLEVRQRHAELIAAAESNRLARRIRQARKARARLARRLLGAQQPAPLDPHDPVVEPAAVRGEAEQAAGDREPVGACRVNSL